MPASTPPPTNATMPLVAVVGPTAVGKSELALELARRLGAQIVNADSMQLYQGMDIGTAKLSVAQRQGIPHHLLDVWPVTHTAVVADYQQRARQVIAQLSCQGVPVVVVGGSGLYLKAVLDRVEFPGTDPQIRQAWEQRLAAEGSHALHELLARRDPQAAQAIDPANGRRIVRALEVIELTGRPFLAHLPPPSYVQPTVQIGLTLPRPQLDERINLRVELMWRQGMLEEVNHLLSLGLRQGRTASKALGYASAIRQLDGELTGEQAQAETAQLTRRFARRQESWFRRDPRIHWVNPTTVTPAQILAALAPTEGLSQWPGSIRGYDPGHCDNPR